MYQREIFCLLVREVQPSQDCRVASAEQHLIFVSRNPGLTMDTDSLPDSLPSFEASNPSVMLNPGDMLDEQIEIPSENDVLCGRGGSINSHKGNEQFRDLVEKRKRVYLTARFKREKRLIASSIVSEIRAMDPPGRFLARKGNKDSGYWYDIGDEKARDKTSQALRENAPSIRAVIETEINEQRAEMKRHETDQHIPKPAPSYDVVPPTHPYYHQPPPHHPSHQSYWDWYHHYYGYPPPAQIPPHYPPPPPPHAAPVPVIPIAIPAHPPPPPPPPHAYWGQTIVPTTRREKNGEEFKEDSMDDLTAQEEEDHRLALELQQEEKAALYEARKARYKTSLANRSNACLGSTPTRSQVAKPQSKVAKRGARPFDDMDATDMTQEEQDHRLAVALQDQEDNVLRQHLQAAGSSSRKTSRSNAFSQAARVSRRGSMSSDNSNSFGPFDIPASFVAWINNDAGAKPKATAQRRRSVQFKDDDLTSPLINHHPGNLQRQSSTASADRPLQPQAEQNTSLLSQVANHIIGSWENGGSSQFKSSNHSHCSHDDDMETEGLEVQLRDPHDETSMPSPSPRVQIDWSSRMGSCHSWIPDTMNTGWANSNNSLSESTHAGISSVNSLDMDTSGNQGSVGGASLCQIFEQDESIQRALREVPSWERSMRSKSPLSIASVEESDISMIRVRELKLFRAAAMHIRRSSSGDMDWDDHPEQS